MDSFLLQKQIKDNAADLQDFCKDLKEWGEQTKLEEQKRKNPQKVLEKNVVAPKPKKKSRKIKELKNNEKNSNTLKVIDYSSWDKYDAEAECARLDGHSSEESDISDEIDEASMDFAMQEKEKGNKFVKENKWNEAIQCYTKAIDTYAYDPIFYANRALCLLKQENYKKAEADCTIALKLDKTYVKAYQRRAAARQKLNLLAEAKNDLLKVLEFEPRNTEAKSALTNLNKMLVEPKKPEEPQRPVSKFTLSRQKKDNLCTIETKPPADEIAIKKHVKENVEPFRLQTVVQAKIDTEKKTPIWPSVENIEIIKPIYKLPNLRSKKPLKRVDVQEVETITNIPNVPEKIPKASEEDKAIEIIEKVKKNLRFEPKMEMKEEKEKEEFTYPRTAMQFFNCWKSFGKNREKKYNYLKKINGKDISAIFKGSVEMGLFSEILETLASSFIKHYQPVYDYFYGLTQVKRFSALVMFMTADDKKNAKKLLDYLKAKSEVSNEQINKLKKSYELKY